MALVTCPECGKERVSDTAAACPECGYNIKKHFDKLKADEKNHEKARLRHIETVTVKCPNCGEKVVGETLRCPECDFPLDVEFENALNRDKPFPSRISNAASFGFRGVKRFLKDRNGKIIAAVILAVTVCITAALVIGIYDQNTDHPDNSISAEKQDEKHYEHSAKEISEAARPTPSPQPTEAPFTYTDGNIKYIVKDGVLTISGSGAMKDYTPKTLPKYLNDTSVKQSIRTAVIESGITYIGDYAFYQCENLANVEIPNSVSIIGSSAFEKCMSLSGIQIPDSVVLINKSAFSECTGLVAIAIPNNVTSIPYGLFYHCKNLKSVKISNETVEIGNLAFKGCSSLTSINLPNSITSIAYTAFYGCSSLNRVVIPENLSIIGEGAFAFCTGLTEIIIPNKVDLIRGHAFYECKTLSSISIPLSVNEIKEYAFDGCNNLVTVYYSGNKADWEKIKIEEGNDKLLNANIIFKAESSEKELKDIGESTAKQIILDRYDDIYKPDCKLTKYNEDDTYYYIRVMWKNSVTGNFNLWGDYKVNRYTGRVEED